VAQGCNEEFDKLDLRRHSQHYGAAYIAARVALLIQQRI
jgi:hypothetical protein